MAQSPLINRLIGFYLFSSFTVDSLKQPIATFIFIFLICFPFFSYAQENKAPVAVPDAYTVNENGILNGSSVLINDKDKDGDELTAVLVSEPTYGTLIFNRDGTFTYKPFDNFSGNDFFTYKAIDAANAESDVVRVKIAVKRVTGAPVAVADAYTVDEGATLTVAAPGVLANDTDAEGDVLSAVLVSGTTNGSLSLLADGSFSYTHNGSETTSDSFSYSVNDGSADSNTATVSISITPVNDAPVASPQSVTTDEDVAVAIILSGSDIEGDALTYAIVTLPAHGTLSGTAPNLTYTPNANYHGNDSFSYSVNDGSADSNTATVSISITPVNDAPVAVADAYTVDEGATLTVAAPGVLANDTDAEGDVLSAVLVSGTTNGSLSLLADGSFSYTHNGSETTSDSFSYSVNDTENAESNVVTVTITITLANYTLQAINDNFLGRENEVINGNVLANDAVGALVVASSIVENPANGTVILYPNGEFTYTPNLGFSGQDYFTYRVCDASSACANAIVYISLLPYDSDGDSIPDVVECGQNFANPVDTDNDGIPDYLDLDSDNDGIPDIVEAGLNPETPVDTDGDNVPDYIDLDSDGDGKTDKQEGIKDCDADGIANYIDNDDPCQEKILISQGFSPNGDGNNDFWKIFLIENYPANNIQIYNRWGAMVFTIKGYNNEDKVWIGESNHGSVVGGNKLTDGTYFYLINLGDGSKTYTGYVVIKR